MAKNIKSKYILNHIFSHINEILVFDLIKYNKIFKNILGINLTNYKLLNGKYIKYESDKIGKLYNAYNNILIYEGDYLKGKRQGKGKEYFDEGNLKFEGEYLNWKRNGKGKEYDIYGKLKFEGEYLDGKRNRKGKEYDIYGNIIYEGEYYNGKRSKGKGKEFDIYGNLVFEGEFLNGEINGKGKHYNIKREIIFEGEYLNGKIWKGKGKEYDIYEQLRFEGECLNGKKWNGKEFDKNGNIISQINNGKGIIKEYYNDFIKFEGEYIDGERKGKEYDDNGKLIFEGEYLNGQNGMEKYMIWMVLIFMN